jgi:hypothetical protein
MDMIFSLAIANDAPEAHRKKAGDIIAIRPGDWQWGHLERQQYLIVLVDFGDLFRDSDEAEKLVCPLFADGEAWWPDADAVQPEIIAKRRYRLPVAELDAAARAKGLTVDWVKVRDEQADYQPFLDAQIALPGVSFVENKASGLKLGAADLALIRDYGKFEKIGS